MCSALKALPILAASLFLAALAGESASDSYEYPNAIKLSSRYFDLGVNPDSVAHDSRLISLNGVAWLRQIINLDPALNGTVVQIRSRPQAASRLWSFSSPANSFIYRILEPLGIEGYEGRSNSESNQRSFMLLPKVPPDQFSVLCHLSDDGSSFFFCTLSASYPPDPNIFLMVRLYNPSDFERIGSDLREIADRARALAYCLDVTDRSSAELQDESSSVDAMPQPDIANCSTYLPS